VEFVLLASNDVVTDLINALPGNSSVNTVQQATIEAVFSVDPTEAPIDWLNSDHVICVYSRSMSIPPRGMDWWMDLLTTYSAIADFHTLHAK
jgi:hypothetical protein